MTMPSRVENPIHQRLMQNRCPKCEQILQVVEKTDEKLVRKCSTCRLTIEDDPKTAEYPR